MTRPWESIITKRQPAGLRAQKPRGTSTAWLISLLVRAAVLLAVGVTIPHWPQGGAGGGGVGRGIVLTAQFGGMSPSYLREPATSRFELPNAAPALLEITPTARPSQQPRLNEVVQASAALPYHQQPPLASRSNAGMPASHGQAGDGRGQTQLFGVPGRGWRFVYVFDRSASMEGARLAAAKRELIASLHSLESRHQFQVIFYSQQPEAMSLSRGGASPLVMADERGKLLAERFTRGILADGPTHHLPALELALRMRPDVIFFLTDADEPQLTAAGLQHIRRLNGGTVINTIEFAAGPPAAGYNFLRQLAVENGGQHAYVDVSRLSQ